MGTRLRVAWSLSESPVEAEIIARAGRVTAACRRSARSAERAAAAGDLYGREGSAAAAPRRGARERNGGVCRPVAECPVLDYKFVALGHNTVRGAAGAAVLNAELMNSEGLLD